MPSLSFGGLTSNWISQCGLKTPSLFRQQCLYSLDDPHGQGDSGETSLNKLWGWLILVHFIFQPWYGDCKHSVKCSKIE